MGFMTNLLEMEGAEGLLRFRGLCKCIRPFCITKYDLNGRSIFHWVPRREYANIATSFLALMCIRTLEYRMGLQQQRY